ncbi:MAG: hypothetical protein MPI91_06760 [Nitrosopumilus sp.]|nr:hypothetical protein [Nitrosopumilus sp.]
MDGRSRLTITEVGMLVIAISLTISAFSVDSFANSKIDSCDTSGVDLADAEDTKERSAELIEVTLRCYMANSVDLYKQLPVAMYGVAAVVFGAFMVSAIKHGLFRSLQKS